MEDADKKLILKISKTNKEVKRLYDQHLELDNQVSKLENQNFLTAAEQKTLKELKKSKLSGLEKIMRIVKN